MRARAAVARAAPPRSTRTTKKVKQGGASRAFTRVATSTRRRTNGGSTALHGRRLEYGEWRQTEEQRWADLARCGKPRNWKAAMDRLAMCRYH